MSVLTLSFVWKALVTAGLIVLISKVAERAGPFLASVIITLPVFVGPGLFFLSFEQSDGYIARGALFALAGAGPVLVFTAVYVQASRWRGFFLSWLAATVAWLVAALILKQLPVTIAVAIASYLAGGMVCWLLRRPFDLSARPAVPAAPWLYLLLRAVAAGIVVALVASLGTWLGPDNAGLVLAFPLTMTASIWLLHLQFGGEFAAATLASTQRSLITYVSFCLTVALLAGPLPALTAWGIGLGICFVVAALVARAGRLRL